MVSNAYYSQCLPGTESGTTLKTTTTKSSTQSTSPPSSSTGDSACGSAAIDQLVGYAAGTTGGGSGSGTTVTSCSAFKSAAARGGLIRVSGILTGCGIVDLVGGTSVIGVGSNSGKSTVCCWVLGAS